MGILTRPAALSYPTTFPGRSRPPPVLGLDPQGRVASGPPRRYLGRPERRGAV